MTPEEQARKDIDQQLGQCGWHVQDHAAMNLSAGLGIAVREFPLKTGFADYLLYVDGKAAGVIEAKPEGHTLTGVETQSAKYNEGLPSEVPHYRLPLPFAYESTGVETQFTNGLNPVPRSREVFTFHRPEELHRLVQLGDDQLPTHASSKAAGVSPGIRSGRKRSRQQMDDTFLIPLLAIDAGGCSLLYSRHYEAGRRSGLIRL